MINKKIKHAIRYLISIIPGVKTLLIKREIFLEKRKLGLFRNREEVFSHIYEVKFWGDNETISGTGSTIRYTENIRKMIPKLVDDLGALVILDAPCGDYNWFRMIEWKREIVYIGGDIVKTLVELNQSLYDSKNTKFINLDIVHDTLPSADLWLCRDCLFHLSNHDIMLALDNFLKSDIPYILTSTHPKCDINHDIPNGSFRLLNLQLPPFNLSKPIRVIDDWIEGFPVRQLALWEREALENNLASNMAFQRIAKRRR